MATKKINFDVWLLEPKFKRQREIDMVMTNDKETVEVIFHIQDMTLTDVSAEVLLFMQDGSFFQNRVADGVKITQGSGGVKPTISYILKDNEGKHAGRTQVQVVAIKDTQHYASQLLKFDIIRGLEEYVVQEIVIKDWETIKGEARALIDDLQQEFYALFDDEGIQDMVAQQLNDLAAIYAPQLSGMQQAEDLRVTQENTRVTQENTRQTNESARIAQHQALLADIAIVQDWVANPSQFDGRGIEYNWNGTQLGIRLEGQTSYQYVQLKGEKGDAGSIDNLDITDIEDALGFVPKDLVLGEEPIEKGWLFKPVTIADERNE